MYSLTFHKENQDWQNSSNFQSLEQLYRRCSKPSAVDTTNPEINKFKLKSDVFTQGVPLGEAFDGYIMLNFYKDYHAGSFIPGFYDDEFAKAVWNRLRKEGKLKYFPPELEDYKTKPWSGKELINLMRQGLH